jgi:hypothetical protein
MIVLSWACVSGASRDENNPPLFADGAVGASDASGPSADPTAPRRVSPAEAKHFRIESVMFEMPLACAEELYGRAEENDTTFGTPIDETRSRAALEILCATHPEIVRSARPDLVLEPREVAYLPLRVATKEHPPRSLASDFLELQVRAAPRDGWPELELETRIHWTDPKGRVLGRLPSSTSPIPYGSYGDWLEIACLPSRKIAASDGTRAVLAFVRATPLP